MISRQQIAEVLAGSLTSNAARGKSFELVAEGGPAPLDLEPLFAGLQHDADGSLDAAQDDENMPMAKEPARVREDWETLAAH